MIILPQNFTHFPETHFTDEYGLLAIGGNLKTETLLKAYANGIFPWFSEDEPICWYAPPERCVIFPEKIKISKSMQQIIKKEQFVVTQNKAFEQVIQHCANIKRKGELGTWIVDEMQAAYIELHKKGFAHSIEVWNKDQLVGGLYGIIQGKIFCGESMFSLEPNTSKLALIHLCTAFDFTMIDCQVENSHLMSMGAEIMERSEFEKLLKANN